MFGARRSGAAGARGEAGLRDHGTRDKLKTDTLKQEVEARDERAVIGYRYWEDRTSVGNVNESQLITQTAYRIRYACRSIPYRKADTLKTETLKASRKVEFRTKKVAELRLPLPIL